MCTTQVRAFVLGARLAVIAAAANLRRHKKTHEKGAAAQVAGVAKASAAQVVAAVAMRQPPAHQLPGPSKVHVQAQSGQQYFQVQGHGAMPIIVQVQNPQGHQQFRAAPAASQGQPQRSAAGGSSSGTTASWPTAYAWPVQAAAAAANPAVVSGADTANWPWTAQWSTAPPTSSAAGAVQKQ